MKRFWLAAVGILAFASLPLMAQNYDLTKAPDSENETAMAYHGIAQAWGVDREEANGLVNHPDMTPAHFATAAMLHKNSGASMQELWRMRQETQSWEQVANRVNAPLNDMRSEYRQSVSERVRNDLRTQGEEIQNMAQVQTLERLRGQSSQRVAKRMRKKGFASATGDCVRDQLRTRDRTRDRDRIRDSRPKGAGGQQPSMQHQQQSPGGQQRGGGGGGGGRGGGGRG
jgi:plasmid maintenance system antidote protein VapI